MNSGLTNDRHSDELGVTFIELLALIFVISVTLLVGEAVTDKFGRMAGIGAGALSAFVCIIAVILFYRVAGRQHAQQCREFREKYTRVYRVLAMPANEAAIKKAQGAEIKVDDFGWEAAPLLDDGLIYLQGLNPQWRVVWYAGFRPEQIESVATKPQSQYDWNYAWVRNPPPCPFPVQEQLHPSINMGFPMPVKPKRTTATG
ncbi:MAG TPA: hypothetical protein VGY56_08645 [Verrucomicrobiae bacterium]|nr:hypothetical protein [Verrucomicrobiae bacterium]